MPSPPRPQLHPPPSDAQPSPTTRAHRGLRRLQSAHALGARASNQLSPVLLQRREQHRDASPTRVHDAPQRPRTGSNATPPLLPQPSAVTTTKRAGLKAPVFSHGHLSLQQIIRDGPADGDFQGALESARWKVVDEGVKSAEDGMVRPSHNPICRFRDNDADFGANPSPRCVFTSGSFSLTPPSCQPTTT